MSILIKTFCSIIQKFNEKNPCFQSPDYGWVLMFHEVVTSKGGEEDITITFDSFKNMISELQKYLKAVDIDSILKTEDKKQLFITFDDVYQSAYENAMKWLEENNIPFCCFISPGLVGKTGYINKEQLRNLEKFKQCSIKFHGKNHVLFRGCSDSYIKEEIMSEKNDRDCMFAYPYGSKYAVPSKAVEMARKMGYRCAFGTYRLPLNKRFVSRNNYFLPRININENNYKNVIAKVIKHV